MRFHLVIACAVALLLASPAFANESVMTDGKVGTITLAEDAKVGELALTAGDYRVQHRVDGEKHVMHFSPTKDLATDLTAEVECDMDANRKKWRKTQVWLANEGSGKRVTRIMLKGEKVAYVFR